MAELLSGAESWREIPGRIAGQQTLLLTSRSARQRPELQALARALGESGPLQEIPFSTPLLRLEHVAQVAKKVSSRPQTIVAVGGGTVIDLAKSLKLWLDAHIETVDQLLPLASTGGADLRGSRCSDSGTQTLLVAIPTTAGSGSEATCFATLYRGSVKESLEDPRILPELVVHDPTLLPGVPGDVAAACALDTLSHALESVWSIHASDSSIALSLQALEVALGSSLEGIRAGDAEALARMQIAAYRAGQAINLTRTTLAHALSYPLRARLGLPHGLAVFLALPAVIRFNSALSAKNCRDERGPAHVLGRMKRLLAAIGLTELEELASWAQERTTLLGFSPALTDYGVTPRDLPAIVATALGSPRSGNNPRIPDLEALVDALAAS